VAVGGGGENCALGWFRYVECCEKKEYVSHSKLRKRHDSVAANAVAPWLPRVSASPQQSPTNGSMAILVVVEKCRP